MTFSQQERDRLGKALRDMTGRTLSLSGCPSSERIAAAIAGELKRNETRMIVEHTIACAGCAEAWRLGRETSALGEVSPDEVSQARARLGTWLVSLTGVAAAVTIGIAIVMRLR